MLLSYLGQLFSPILDHFLLDFAFDSSAFVYLKRIKEIHDVFLLLAQLFYFSSYRLLNLFFWLLIFLILLLSLLFFLLLDLLFLFFAIFFFFILLLFLLLFLIFFIIIFFIFAIILAYSIENFMQITLITLILSNSNTLYTILFDIFNFSCSFANFCSVNVIFSET